jgi:hypothetical protein
MTAMTKERKKKRSKRIRRHVISLPSHANRFDNDDTITNVENGSAKCNDYICKFVHLLSTLCYFCSLPIVMMEIYNFRIAPILGFGLFLFKILVFDLFLFIMGNIRYWPKTVSRKEINININININDININDL